MYYIQLVQMNFVPTETVFFSQIYFAGIINH